MTAIHTPLHGETGSRSGTDLPPGNFESLFTPRVVALVGATDRSRWSEQVHANLCRLSHGVTVHCVNPRGGTVHGAQAFTSLAEIQTPVDLVYIMSPRETVPAVVREAGARGARAAIVLTAGFGELEDGADLEAELAAAARESGVRLLGPNVSGFLNVADGVYPFGLALPDIPPPGSTSYVMQSGGLVKPMLSLASAWGCGTGVVACTGNETLTTVVDAIETILDDGRTRSIGLFLETVRDPEGLRCVAARARERDVALVALTVGHSDVSRRTAQAHTGALAGDANVRSAALRAMGIIEVSSMEELVVTTDLMARGVRPRGSRVAVIGASGGACSVIADAADRERVTVPDFLPGCADALDAMLPGLSHAQNPLDVTGVATTDKALPIRALETVLEHEATNIDAVLFEAFVLPPPGEISPETADFYHQLGETAATAPVPVLLLDEVASAVPEQAHALFESCTLTRLPGTALGVRALAHAVAWTQVTERSRAETYAPQAAFELPTVDTTRVPSEHEALDLLQAAGARVVPHLLATSPGEAVEHAASLGGPVALKVCSGQVLHKSDLGGVSLGRQGAEEVRDAYSSIVRSASAALPDVTIDGVLVAPMRTGESVELIAGVHRDPTWGPVLVVGLGGVYTEVLGDVSLRLMPIGPKDVDEMLDELSGAALLGPARGRPGVHRGALIDAILAIARTAHALGDDLESLEVNPLRADDKSAEALDALITWTPPVNRPIQPGGRQ